MIKIDVATGQSAVARTWKNRRYIWPDFVSRLRDPHVTHERYAEFLAMSKKEQVKVKDVGGYVAGYLNNGHRGKSDVMHRSALTLDLDFAPYDFWDTFTMFYDCAAALHSTHKHSPETPRYRLVVPLDRPVTPDEYIAIARRFAQDLDIEYFDPTTFDTNRLMFWPSVSKDGEYVFEEQDGDPLRADDTLARYQDWRDISEWAFSKTVKDQLHAERAKTQEDPLTKNNIVGYFCQAYDIHEAIAEFLPDVYELSSDDRYTYLLGSTASGAVVYDGKYLYSHHGTDPASGTLRNAFDLVRAHKFGADDREGDTTKSYKLMSDFCRSLPQVRKEIVRGIVRDFDEYVEVKPDYDNDPYERVTTNPEKKARVTGKANAAAGEPKTDEDRDPDWRTRLVFDKFNKPENSAHNVTLIMRNDTKIKNRLRHDLFSGKKFTVDAFPWHVDTQEYPRTLRDVDYSGLRNYIERAYSVTSPQKIDDVIQIELNRNSFHPVRDYFNSLEWDGQPRIDKLLIDCFNAVDNAYTREVSRKWMVACVARVMSPGCKFDTVITLVGEEGTRKSSFFRKLGMGWFSDSFSTVTGKEAFEQLQGKLVIEIAELSALDKAESVQIKHYISKQVDSFRPAYGRETVDYPRQCVFTATSNNRTFLRDADGNRRFWPVDVNLNPKTAGVLDPMSREFDDLIPRLWSEAVAAWRLDEPLTLSNEAELIADEERAGHVEVDVRAGVIEEYLNTDLPVGWDDMSPDIRADYLADPGAYGSKTGVKSFRRASVCLLEIWCECFGKRKEDFNRRVSFELSGAMRSIPGWRWSAKPKRVKHYGLQKVYERNDE
jgi:predicted P-loop ATPase